MTVQKNIISILIMFVLVACQPQAPSMLMSATTTDDPTPVHPTSAIISTLAATPSSSPAPTDRPTPTVTPETTPTPIDEPPDPIQFESIEMFDENGSGESEKISGWAVAILPDGYEYVLHTEDGGKTWTHPTPTMGLVYTYSPPIFLSSQIAWNTNLDGILERTLDGGKTWNTVWDFADRFGNGDASNLYFWDANHGMAVWGSVGAGNAFVGLSETDDGGATWSRLALNSPWEGSLEQGLLHLCNLCGFAIYVDASRIMILSGTSASHQKVEKELDITISYDRGKTWSLGKATLPEGLEGRSIQYGTPHFFDEKRGVFYIRANDQSSFEYFDEYSMLFPFYTDNGGLTWEARVPTPPSQAVYAGLASFLSADDAIVPCDELLCVTNDGAHSWTLVQPDIKFKEVDTDGYLVANYLEDLDFLSPTVGFAVLSTMKTQDPDRVTQLYQTRDAGSHWVLVDSKIGE